MTNRAIATRSRLWTVMPLVVVAATLAPSERTGVASEQRRTAMVRAVERVRPSVVNLRGNKTLRPEEGPVGASGREVNGMGTGVILDERGYIITNNHVIEGVRQIDVTLADGTTTRGVVVASDPKADLAIIKITPSEKLQVAPIGTSSDLMVAESVIAVGNAYGYEHTVTRGVISALHRSVQVSDTQSYTDLIQTDASINPGNSGGPLLNIDGELIGINVAVRAGAQGIGFAIPVDQVVQVAAQLMSIENVDQNWHGMAVKAGPKGPVVDKVLADSPAAKSELKPGDLVKSVGGQTVTRPLDVERAFLGRKTGEEVSVEVERNGKTETKKVSLARHTRRVAVVPDRNWEMLGMRLAALESREARQELSRYNGGLRVVAIRPDGPARKQGIRPGDLLVGLHIWETISLDNVEYVLTRSDLADLSPLKFYVVRGGETLIGRLPVNSATR
jgi:serine protease Do